MHPTIKTARAAFDTLSQVFYAETYNYAEQLLAMCKEEERGHRGFMDGFRRSHTDDTASVSDAAKMFAVVRVAEYLLHPEQFPKGASFLHMQRSCFMAAGIVDKYGGAVEKAWAPFFQIQQLAALNYTDIVKIRREELAGQPG